MKRKVIDKEVITSEYLKAGRSVQEACKQIGCSPTILLRSMKEQGLVGKSKSWNHHRTNKYPQLQDREWLARQLADRSAQSIAKEIGTTSGNISDFMKRYGLRSQRVSTTTERLMQKIARLKDEIAQVKASMNDHRRAS